MLLNSIIRSILNREPRILVVTLGSGKKRSIFPFREAFMSIHVFCLRRTGTDDLPLFSV